MSQHVLALIPLPSITREALIARHQLHYHPNGMASAQWSSDEKNQITVVITNGTSGLSRSQMEQLPQLRLVYAYGVGYENVDLGAASQLRITVANSPGANGDTVADHALGFMLALARDYGGLTTKVRNGQWKSSRDARPALNGSTLGIVGMGRVGQAIARRAAAFDMRILYTQRRQLALAGYQFEPDLNTLAMQSDYLVTACPGGVATHHLINREVLTCLGSEGYLINVARGSVVCTADLILALAKGEIAGAGLDVWENEPELPAELCKYDNVLLTPHMSGRSPASQQRQRDMLIKDLETFLSNQALESRITA